MGHDEHFLSRLDRVKPAHVEFALGLYRDHELVHHVLERAPLPESAERVAISMEHPRKGPFVVVARTGRFVTVLKEGMSTGDLPIVTREQFDPIAGRFKSARAKLKRAGEVVGTESELHRLFGRIVQSGHEMCREDFESLALLQPMLGPTCLSLFVSMGAQVDEQRTRMLLLASRSPRAIADADLRSYWRRIFGMGHLLLLSLAGDEELRTHLPKIVDEAETTMTHLAVDQRVAGLAMRGAWAAALVGAGLYPSYRKNLTEESNELFFDALFGITAIGLRNPARRGEARGILASASQAKDLPPDRKPLLEVATAVLEGTGITPMEDVIELGRARCMTAGERAPLGSPYHFARPEDVPEEWARTAAVDGVEDPCDPGHAAALLRMLPTVVALAPGDFYFPRAYARPFDHRWSRETVLEILRRFPVEKGETVVKGEKVGRNEPCPCGSGKKYKRCHGAAA